LGDNAKKINPFSNNLWRINLVGEDDIEIKNLVGLRMLVLPRIKFHFVQCMREYFCNSSGATRPNLFQGKKFERFHYNDIVCQINSEGDIIWARILTSRGFTQGDGGLCLL